MLTFDFSQVLFCFILQKKCIRKCLKQLTPLNMPSKIPEELADEDNDPVRPSPTSHRFTFSPGPLVSSFYFILNNIFAHHPLIAARF